MRQLGSFGSRAAVIAIALGALFVGSFARADVFIPPDPGGPRLEVRSVRALEVSAPVDDRDAAITAITSAMYGFQARIEQCVAARDPRGREGRPGGTVRARVRYERSELPTRHRVVDSSLGASASACVAEVLPSLVVRPAPRGELTVEITLARAHYARPW